MMIPDATTASSIALSDGVAFDLTTLIETRLIIQANSGGGKTWAIRRLLEQSHGLVQHIIIDVEGSLRTLREQYEYVLLGSETDETDYPISQANAAEIVIPLLSMRTSVILDLYEFLPSVRQRLVRLFLEALINAPKPLWHDCLVVIDEAHIFYPERGNCEAKPAVEALCSRGRARGFCAILATQRISKLGKDALGECNNKLIGRASLDVDMKRSNTELEFPSPSQALKRLAPGDFYVFGPAISPEVQQITIGPVLTTHPKAGSRRQMSSPPPPESLNVVLDALRALAVSEEEAKTGSEKNNTPRERGDKGEQTISVNGHDPDIVPMQPLSAHTVALLAEKDAEILRLRRLLEQLSAISVSVDGFVLPVTQLPSVLHVDTLSAQVAMLEVQTSTKTLPGQDRSLAKSNAALAPCLAVQQTPLPDLLQSEQTLLKRLIVQVRALSPTEKSLFIWLIEHDGTEVSSQQLADAVSMDITVTWTRQTKRLVKLPFIHRQGTSKFLFKAQFGVYVVKYFKSVSDPKVITRQLVKVAQQ